MGQYITNKWVRVRSQEEDQRERKSTGAHQGSRALQCVCHRQASTNLPTSFKWTEFLFLHLQILFLYSALCIMFFNELVIGFYSLPHHFISTCSLIMLLFSAFKNNFYSYDAIHFHQSLIWLVRICQNLELMSSPPFLIGNHKNNHFFVILICKDTLWMWFLFSLVTFFIPHLFLDSGSIPAHLLHWPLWSS